MLPERPSPLALDQTVQRISSAATAAGWIVQGVSPIDESVAKHGGPRDRPVRLIKLCQADHAGRILGEGGWGGRADGGAGRLLLAPTRPERPGKSGKNWAEAGETQGPAPTRFQ